MKRLEQEVMQKGVMKRLEDEVKVRFEFGEEEIKSFKVKVTLFFLRCTFPSLKCAFPSLKCMRLSVRKADPRKSNIQASVSTEIHLTESKVVLGKL